MPLIARVLPRAAVAVEAFQDVPESMLYPVEAEQIARAVDKRRREFATVRYCARQALARLGIAPAPLLPDERGAPRWPAGVVGSMTHCDGYRAAAVARPTDLHALGVDAEPHAELPDGVLRLVTRPEERAELAARAGADGRIHWGRLLFSAKESVFKAWYPLARRWLGFDEAVVDLRPDGAFHATLLVDGLVVAGEKVSGFTGRWLVAHGLVLTAVAVPASSSA